MNFKFNDAYCLNIIQMNIKIGKTLTNRIVSVVGNKANSLVTPNIEIRFHPNGNVMKCYPPSIALETLLRLN